MKEQSAPGGATSGAVGQTVAVTIHGELRTYPNDKEGKRQAILDGLNAIETVTVGQDVYLPSNECLQLVASVLYPGGIQTQEAYQTVCQVTEKACAHLGFGGEVTLGPPAVPFARRGAYRQQIPPLDAQLVRAELAAAGISSQEPQQEIADAMLWQKVGMAVYGRSWKELTAAEQMAVQAQVAEVARQEGWQCAADGSYQRPLAIDEAGVRRRLGQLAQGGNGRPLVASSVVYQVQVGAYGRGFYTSELAPALQALVAEVLPCWGYCPTPEGGEYRLRPVALVGETAAELGDRLAGIEPVMTELGPVLLWREVAETICAEAVSAWQAEQLVRDDRVARALRQVGYQTELKWCQPYHFQPKRTGHEAEQVVLQEVRVRQDPQKKLSLAKGLAVFTPALTIDDQDDTLVYLEMVGAKQSVQANWAALVGACGGHRGSKVHWLGRQRVRLDGMKEHVKIQATLPCGWANQILIHKQASLKEMNPERPFYLLDDGTQAIPPLFYAMLNKCLALPLLPDWADYLWADGRERRLITLLDEGLGQGYAAWRVLPTAEEWQGVVADGLERKQIQF
jgi:hypothetical protein